MGDKLELSRSDFVTFKFYLSHRGVSWETFKDLEKKSKLGFVEGWWVRGGSKAYSKNDLVDHQGLLSQLSASNRNCTTDQKNKKVL